MSNILPRYVRYRDAPGYLGMDRNRFDEEVRPKLTEIPIGDRGIAFDRLDLDAWADQYKDANGRPGKAKKKGEDEEWATEKRGVSGSAAAPGISTDFISRASKSRFTKAVARATSTKPAPTETTA